MTAAGTPGHHCNDHGPLLTMLNHTAVQYVVVGHVAACARAGSEADQAHGLDVEIAPDPTPANLAALADAINSAGQPRLVTGDGTGLPVLLGAAIFSLLPVLPLRTDLGDVTVLLRPPGAPSTYRALMFDCSPLEIDGVIVQVPTVHALLRGLAAGRRGPDPRLMADLRAAKHRGERQQPPVETATGSTPLTQLVVAALGKASAPASVRDLVRAVGTVRSTTYRDIRAAADQLAEQGQVLRTKSGAANRYELNADRNAQAARLLADLLQACDSPEEVTRLALQLVQGTDRI